MMERLIRPPLLLAALFFLFLVTGGPAADRLSLAGETSVLQTVTLKIDGMDCSACAKDIRSAILKTQGVKTAEVKVKKKWFFWNDFSDAHAVVEYDQSQATVDNLIKAVEGASNSMFTYHARLLN